MSNTSPEFDRLARNVERILGEAGIAKASDVTAGFRVLATQWGVDVTFSFGDYLEPSHVRGVEDPRHRDHPLLVFRRSVDMVMLTAYSAVLHAAGFTVTIHPADENDNEHLMVTAGPLEGIDPTQEIKDLHQ
ncbi:hypothetical protein ACQEU6_46365 [Spirillospora sp. CA-108201]